MTKKFMELSDEFLDYIFNIRGYSENSIITYSIALKQMFEYSKIYEEDGLLIFDITLFRFHIVENHRRTIAKKLSAIHSFVRYLEDIQDYEDIKIIGDESIKVTQGLPKPIDEIYIDEVLESVSLQEKLIIYMLYGLGMRISELGKLKLEDIKEKWLRVKGKGNKVREIPILPTIKDVIDLYIQAYEPQKYLLEKSKSNLTSSQIRYRLDKPFKALGLKVTPHQLRHSFASHLINNGARISDVSELLGHASMATTQIYTKLNDKKKLNDYMKAHPLSDL